MSLLYNTGIFLFDVAVHLASPFHSKAGKMVKGRKGWRKDLEKAVAGWEKTIWIHCASLGEFEQGRPLIEAIRKQHPEQKILLTFFSPSGYEIRKNYAQADHVAYLPMDTPGQAKAFLETVKPSLAVFVKYDIWLNMLGECRKREVPVVLVSALLRPESKFLNSILAAEYQKAFSSMRYIFTQDEETKQLLSPFCKSERLIVAGDTRFDRAIELPQKFEPLPEIEAFIRGRTCVVAGSPWPKDEALILPTIERLKTRGLCWIIAPHEIHPDAIEHACRNSNGSMARLSRLQSATGLEDVLWIDNVGMLSRLYHYATVAYIGGGFGTGIHNTQEPAVYGCPVIFGPKFEKFREAVDMIGFGGAASVQDQMQLESALINWLDHPDLLAATRAKNQAYMRKMAGATGVIIEKLASSSLLSQA